MQNRQNQTDPQWLRAAGTTKLGTGIFLIADVTRPGPDAFRKQLVRDLTYTQCLERGTFALAFKWIPTSVASYSSLADAACGEPCVDTCVEFGCVCYNGVCR
jgi:hypothetical protein